MRVGFFTQTSALALWMKVCFKDARPGCSKLNLNVFGLPRKWPRKLLAINKTIFSFEVVAQRAGGFMGRMDFLYLCTIFGFVVRGKNISQSWNYSNAKK